MIANHTSLLAGMLVGLSVAMPIGPMGLLCIQRTLTSGRRVGICTGLGAATMNTIHAGIIIAGLERLAPLMASASRLLGLVGGLFLLWCAARTLLRRRTSLSRPGATQLSPVTAYGTALTFNAINPMSLGLMLALLSPVIEISELSLARAAMLLLGVFTAVVAWWVCLASGVDLLRSRLSPGMLFVVNQIAGIGLLIYGTVAFVRSAGL